MDIESPVIYHYLTYEIELPSPMINHVAKNGPPPSQPDLGLYISPFLWSKTRKKRSSVPLLHCNCLHSLYSRLLRAPSLRNAEEWNVSTEAVLVRITTFCCGFAIAPIILAPFSEINSRYPIFTSAGIFFETCQVCCAITRSYSGMITARFWAGAGSSVFLTMDHQCVQNLTQTPGRPGVGVRVVLCSTLGSGSESGSTRGQSHDILCPI